MTKQDLVRDFWREIGIDCPDWASPDLGLEELPEVAEAAKAIEERKIANFCATRGIILE